MDATMEDAAVAGSFPSAAHASGLLGGFKGLLSRAQGPQRLHLGDENAHCQT